MCLKYGNKRHIRISRGTTWLYLSSLFFVFLTISGLSLKLLEFLLEIISILLLSAFLNIYSVGWPSRSICFMWARSSGEMWSLTTDKVLWTLWEYPLYSPPRKHTNLPGSNPKWIIASFTISTWDVSMQSCCLQLYQGSWSGWKSMRTHFNTFGIIAEKVLSSRCSLFKLQDNR